MVELFKDLIAFLSELGPLGVIIGLAIEVIPSEIVLAWAGYLVLQGEMGFVEAVIAGTIGGIIAQLLLYVFGRYGGRPIVIKYGKYVLIRPNHLELAERWFEKYGDGVVFFARFIPVVRHAISIPAGMVKMGVWRFTILTGLAAIPWSIFFIWMGMEIGSNWSQIKEVAKDYIWLFVIGAVGLFVIYYLIVRFRKKTDETKESVVSGE